MYKTMFKFMDKLTIITLTGYISRTYYLLFFFFFKFTIIKFVSGRFPWLRLITVAKYCFYFSFTRLVKPGRTLTYTNPRS